MKVDRRNPWHWWLLLLTGGNALAAVALRLLMRRRRRLVLLYGHKLGGNLLAIYRHLRDHPEAGIEVVFLTMDPGYHRELFGQGERAMLASSPRCIPLLTSAAALVSDHGLHALLPLLRSDLKFFDAWHGIPFKGFDADDFRVQHRYEETWVPSPLLARIYAMQYAFPPKKIVVTGYARTDRLVRENDAPRASLRARLGLPADGKVVLFAPTWKQDADERSVFPFGIEPDAFCAALSSLARRTGATVVLRTHLNSGPGAVDVSRHERLHSLPYADYPDTEEVLLATDVLVCDWSSIAFDFLLLDRPTVFIDVPPPFAKGLSLGPSYRFGAVAKGMPALEGAVEQFLARPGDYRQLHGAHAAKVRNELYGALADGKATQRCVERLLIALSSNPFDAVSTV